MKKISKRKRHAMKMPLMSFMEMVKKKIVTWDDIDDFVEMWHISDCDCELHEYLGMTEAQYKLWLERPELSHHISYV